VIKMKVMIFSDSPEHESGMGRAVRNIGRQLNRSYELAYLGWHRDGMGTALEGTVPIFPCRKQTQEKTQREEILLFESAINSFTPNILITLGDISDFRYLPTFYERYNFKWLPYFNVDGKPIREYFLWNLTTTPFIMTTSKFGAETVWERDPSIDVRTVYHGYDPDVFYPVNVESKIHGPDGGVKKDLTDKFVVFMDSQNTHRKNYPAALRGFAKFAQDKRDICLLMLTQPDETGEIWMNTYDIKYLVRDLGLHDKVLIYANDIKRGQMLPDEELNRLYNLSDVYLSTARAEGFGLSVLQAMATETVCVAPDYASYSELLADGRGRLINIAEFDVEPGSCRHSAIPDTDHLAEILNELYMDWHTGKKQINSINEKSKKFADCHTWEKSVDKINDNIIELAEKKKVLIYPKVPNLYRPMLRGVSGRILNGLAPAKETVGMVVMGGMGDNIQTIPVVKGIARRHPDSKLLIICEAYSDVFNGLHPNSDAVEARGESFAAILKTLYNQFDYFYDIRYVSRCYERSKDYEFISRGNIETYYEQWPWANNVIWQEGYHVVEMRYKTAGLEEYASMDDMTFDGLIPCETPDKKYVVVNNGSGGIGKLKTIGWYTWIPVVNHLKKDYMVLQLGTRDDEKIPGAVDLRGRLRLRESAYFIKNSEFVVCPEGGLYHMAKSVGKRAVVWLSVTNPEFFAYDDSIVLPCKNTREFKCEPCWWKGNDYFHNRCMRGLDTCVNLPDSNDLVSAIDRMKESVNGCYAES